ncbi:UNVERIFIED_CONTAM: hypothetical protein GTU68_004888 [Idotea baltica]|nr:hypothetical protein [Idotea baltica]
MKSTRKTFSLNLRFEKIIADQIELGRFENASEVVRAGLRLLEDQEARMAQLRKSISQGEASSFTHMSDVDEVVEGIVTKDKV